MPLPFKRADRVAGLIQEELSRLLLREVKDPRVHQVTITAVRVSGDLRHARVSFTGPGGQGGTEETLTGLQSAAGFLRGQLGRTLRLRYAPELTFEADESVERSLHVAALLKRVAAREGDEGE
ncbi:MAG: 30S ribosome-binding factor RbfA [candidate division NC10 bacterium]|nr:30S ribosome-binding factor RbfA [candidate division NC10 bacterium]